MTFTERHFYTALVISLLIHTIVLSSVVVRPEEEKHEDFKELTVKLGVRKVTVADNRKSYFHDIEQAFTSPARQEQPKSLPEKRKIVRKKTAEQVEQSVELAKISEGDNGDFAGKGESESTSLLSANEPEQEGPTQEEKPEIIRVMEQAARKVTVPDEKVVAIPKAIIRSMEKEKMGYVLGNSFDKDADELLTYEQMLPLWIEKFKVYPEQARMLNIEGTGVVRIMIKRDGKVLRKEIEKSTGHAILDRALIQMVEDADPVIPVPSDHLPERRSLSYRIEFELSASQ